MLSKAVIILSVVLLASSCTVVKVVDTAASAAIGTVKTTAKVTGKVAGTAVDVVTPGKDEDKEK